MEIIYYLAMSVDGYIATPEHSVDWLPPLEREGQDYGYYAFYDTIEALVMGSKTYEVILRHPEWPYAGKPSWVLTRRELPVAHPDITLTSQGPLEVARELEERGIRRVWLVGGGELASAFRREQLITEYVIAIAPTILGAGIPVLAAPGPREGLALAECTTFPDGMVLLRYLRAQKATPSS